MTSVTSSISSAAPSSSAIDTSTSMGLPAFAISGGAGSPAAATAIRGSLATNNASPPGLFGSTNVAGDEGMSGGGATAASATFGSSEAVAVSLAAGGTGAGTSATAVGA